MTADAFASHEADAFAPDERALTALTVLDDLRRALAGGGQAAAVAVVDEHATATAALLAPDAQLTITATGHYLLHPADQLPEPEPTAEARFGWVAYHGDFEDAYRRVDGDETGYRVPEQLIEAREIAQRLLDTANQAIRRYIDNNNVAEVDLDEPCQPIGCDNGYHLPGCVFAAADEPVEGGSGR